MIDIEQIMKNPEHRAAAGKIARRTLLIYLLTLFVVLYHSGVSGGILGGILFLAVGGVLVPLTISFPSFLAQLKRPKLKWVIIAVEMLTTVAITRALFIGIFG